jgi:dihydroorotate dehydrogenase (NAD+) catalytic subunit
MASADLTTRLGPLRLGTPLIAASGTVGSVWEWSGLADPSAYGAAVAKSVSPVPWPGRPAPRLAPTEAGMLNGIGIQNPGIEDWRRDMEPRIPSLGVPLWGSAVGGDAHGFSQVAKGLVTVGVSAVEVNLSCPNLDDGEMFSFSASRSREVVEAVATAVDVPVGAKLSPNTPELVEVAKACQEGGAAFLVLTNTALGFGVSVRERRPLLSGGVGGYSGPGLKPIALRCVYEVSRAMPKMPIVGCGGVSAGSDVVEYLLAGAAAVAAGTVHLAEPRAGGRIIRELRHEMQRLGAGSVRELIGGLREW